MKDILLVEDDLTYARIVKTFLEKNGYKVKSCNQVREAKTILTQSQVHLVIVDFRLPDGTGMELLTWSKANYAQTHVILITNYSDIRIAIKAMKLGAFEYITKPINPDELLATVNESLAEKQKAIQSIPPLSEESGSNRQTPKKPIPYLIGSTIESEKLENHIQLVAPTDLSVLVLGETGTGKELISQRIHEFSPRKNGPFVAIDCGAIPKELAGSELFGHVKGAFTGALDNKAGHFERAQGGTIFLDEIGNLSYQVQMHLLRAIQERTIRRIGGSKEIAIDVRIIAATNENLLQQSGQGQFREDLYHRLNEFTLKALPLRERRNDLEDFAKAFLEDSNKRLNKEIKGFSRETWEVFQGYSWPGNFRELRNVIKRAVLLTKGDLIQKEALPFDLEKDLSELEELQDSSLAASSAPISTSNYRTQWKDQEKKLIQKVLIDTRFNKAKTARILKIDRKTLYSKMEKYGLNE